MTTFAAYVRVSRVMGREGENFISPDLQREKIEAWAKMKGFDLVHIEPDLDESGGSQDRPGMREAIRMVEAGEVDGIVCAYLSRFARNVAGALADIERIHAAGGSVAFVQENLDPTTPMGKAMLTVLLAFATLERDNAAQGWLDARSAAVARGTYMNAEPFGYGKDDDGRLFVKEDEAAIMRQTYRLAASSGLKAARDYLANATTIKQRGKDKVRCVRQDGDKPQTGLRPAQVARILDNRVYLGEQVADDVLAPYPGHTPLVDRALWESVQNLQPTFRRSRNRSYPLTGVASCVSCGSPLVGAGKMGRAKKHRYICSGYANHTCASSATIDAEALESYALDLIRSQYTDGAGTLLVGRDNGPADLDALQAAIELAEHDRNDFALNTEIQKALGEAAYLLGAQKRTAAVTEAQKAYRAAAGQTSNRIISMPTEVLVTLDADELAEVFSAVYANIVIKPAYGTGKRLTVAERVTIILHSEVESMTTA